MTHSLQRLRSKLGEIESWVQFHRRSSMLIGSGSILLLLSVCALFQFVLRPTASSTGMTTTPYPLVLPDDFVAFLQSEIGPDSSVTSSTVDGEWEGAVALEVVLAAQQSGRIVVLGFETQAQAETAGFLLPTKPAYEGWGMIILSNIGILTSSEISVETRAVLSDHLFQFLTQRSG